MFKLLAVLSIIAIAYAAPGVVVAPVVHHGPLVPVTGVSHSVVHPAPVVKTVVPIVPVVKPVVAVHPVPVVKNIVPVVHPVHALHPVHHPVVVHH